jgi:hypothetical protein
VEESGSCLCYLVLVVFNDSLYCSSYTAMTVNDLERIGKKSVVLNERGDTFT